SFFLLSRYGAFRARPSFPTRRSSDLAIGVEILGPHPFAGIEVHALGSRGVCGGRWRHGHAIRVPRRCFADVSPAFRGCSAKHRRSEEHTSELQSRFELVCRLLLDKTI